MKKLLTGILSLALAASMSIPAFAAETSTGGDTNIPVTGQYQAGAVSADVISVDLAWDAMDFTYTAPSKGTWNPKTHKYEKASAGGWAATTGTNPKITVTNHSNTGITAGFAFNGTVEGLNGSFTKNTLVLSSAECTAVTSAPQGETAFSVSGSAIDASKDLGTITVTVGKFDTTPQEISTADELLATADKTGVFQLANDIDLGSASLNITSCEYTLDLNGHTLTSSSSAGVVAACEGATLTVVNGSLTSLLAPAMNISGGTVAIEGCTLTSGCATQYGVVKISGVMSMKDSVIKGKEWQSGRSVTLEHYSKDGFPVELILSGNVEIDGNIYASAELIYGRLSPTVKALAGTYNFDVSSYVDTTLYDVTNDGATWVVTAK